MTARFLTPVILATIRNDPPIHDPALVCTTCRLRAWRTSEQAARDPSRNLIRCGCGKIRAVPLRTTFLRIVAGVSKRCDLFA